MDFTNKHSHTRTHTFRGLTCDNAIVGRFQHGSIKLNDVLMTQDTKNLSLDEERDVNNSPSVFQYLYIGKET